MPISRTLTHLGFLLVIAAGSLLVMPTAVMSAEEPKGKESTPTSTTKEAPKTPVEDNPTPAGEQKTAELAPLPLDQPQPASGLKPSSPAPAPPSLQAQNPPQPQPIPASGGVVPSTPVSKPSTITSISSSKQFIVHGSDLKLRSQYTDWASDLSSNLQRLLKDANSTTPLPIIINLKTGADSSLIGPAVSTQVSQLAYGGFHLQITVNIRPINKRSEFESELIRLLVAERILREHKELKTSRTKILPDWLLTGITQAQEYRRSAQPSLVFASVFKSGQIFGVDQILTADPAKMDSLNKVIFEASACALVLTLLDQPDGANRFNLFLSALATDHREDRELLLSFFPNLGSSSNSLEKWWSLQMATLATPTVLESMSIKETEDSLTQALLIRYTDSEKDQSASRKALAKTRQPSEQNNIDFEDIEDKSEKKFLGIFKRKQDKEEAGSGVLLPPEVEALAKPGAKPKSGSDKPITDDLLPEEPKKNSILPDFLKKPFGKKKDVFLPFRKKKSTPDDEEEIPGVVKPDLPSDPVDTSPPDAIKRKPSSMRGVSQKPENPTSTDPQPTPPAPKKTEERPVEPLAVPELTPASPIDPMLPPGMLPPLMGNEDPIPGSLPSYDPSLPSIPAFSLPPPQEETLALTPEDFKEPYAIDLKEYRKIWNRKDRSSIFRKNVQLLNGLKQRAHPLYRNLIAAYTEVFIDLSTGKDKNMDTRLQTLETERAKTHEIAKAVENHLDWYEANHTQRYSGSFEEYLRVREKIEEEFKPRRDQVSKYLDTIAKEYE